MKQYLAELITGSKSLVAGFLVTLKAMVSPVVTVQYPREQVPVPNGHRGHPQLVLDETGRPKCIACGSCSRLCPSQCITVQGEKKEGDKRKYPSVFVVDFTRCSLCGTCSEVCPVAALDYSRGVGLAAFTREAYVFDLVKAVPPAPAAPAAAPLPAPADGIPQDA